MEDLDEIREFFAKDRFATENGAVIEAVGKNTATVGMEIESRHRNAAGIVMGGAIFTLADFAFAVASNWQNPGVVGVNVDASFIGVPKSEKIFAQATLVKDGRTICTYKVDVTDENGDPVAVMQCMGFRKN